MPPIPQECALPPPQFHHPDVTDEKYWVRLVDLVDKGNDDVKVKLMHISYPARSFLWPKKDDTCFAPIAMLPGSSKLLVTATGRLYKLDDKDISTIEQVLAK